MTDIPTLQKGGIIHTQHISGDDGGKPEAVIPLPKYDYSQMKTKFFHPYRYRILFDSGLVYQTHHHLHMTKKISKVKLWIIQKILGWRLELQ